MKPIYLILAAVALALVVIVRLVVTWQLEISPPDPVTYTRASAHIEGRKLRAHFYLSKPEPCVPISMQFVRGADGVIQRIPGVRQIKPNEIIYDIIIPDTVPNGEAEYWADEDYQCGAYRKVQTPRVSFWLGPIQP